MNIKPLKEVLQIINVLLIRERIKPFGVVGVEEEINWSIDHLVAWTFFIHYLTDRKRKVAGKTLANQKVSSKSNLSNYFKQ